ncbi:ester cyclase [Streptomyces sp. NPDC052727]|uniref:ester cyclase n=1 Tax=Streptomyces sp. NPDC052727 TaxID=3154854 RepID=UPI0034376767
MSGQTNIAAQTAFAEAVVTGDLDALDKIVAPGSIDHDPAPGQGPGPAGYKAMFGGLRAAFPDLNVAVEHLVATDDELAFAYTISGTHTSGGPRRIRTARPSAVLPVTGHGGDTQHGRSMSRPPTKVCPGAGT